MRMVRTKVNCNAFLNFEPNERPPWRDSLPYRDEIPSTSTMLKDIVQYIKMYNDIKQFTYLETLQKVKKSLIVSFLMSIQIGEEIGVCERGKTEELMSVVEQEFARYSMNIAEVGNFTDIGCARSDERKTDYNFASPKKLKYDDQCTHSLETKVGEFNRMDEYKLEKNIQETVNLCKACKHLDHELQVAQVENKENHNCIGLIEMDSCIKEIHKIVMYELLALKKRGRFSTKMREATFKGEKHTYPHFTEERHAGEAVITLIDIYNEMIDEIISTCSEVDVVHLNLLFKCASLFLFSFLTLHPFCDGNGRVGRLLAAYSMRTFSHFMTPIYNVFDSSHQEVYLDALVKARTNLHLPSKIDTDQSARDVVIEILIQQPTDLCAMLIESNWTMWRQCFKKLGCTLNLFRWEN